MLKKESMDYRSDKLIDKNRYIYKCYDKLSLYTRDLIWFDFELDF